MLYNIVRIGKSRNSELGLCICVKNICISCVQSVSGRGHFEKLGKVCEDLERARLSSIYLTVNLLPDQWWGQEVVKRGYRRRKRPSLSFAFMDFRFQKWQSKVFFLHLFFVCLTRCFFGSFHLEWLISGMTPYHMFWRPGDPLWSKARGHEPHKEPRGPL